MTDDIDPSAADSPTESPDTNLTALHNPTPEYTLDDTCIAIPKATVGYLIENIETQALGIRNHGDPEHYEALCHRLAELRLAYQAHNAFDGHGYGDPITLTAPDRAFGLVFERAKTEYRELCDNQNACGVSDDFLDDIEGALNALDSARINVVTGCDPSTPD